MKPTIRGRDFTICSIVAPTSVIEEQRAAAAAAAAPVVEAAPAEGAAPARRRCRACRCAPRRLPVPRPRLPPRRAKTAPAEAGNQSRARSASCRPTRRCLSPGWEIPARNMRATATMPASSWRTKSTPHYRFGPWRAKFEGLLSEGALAGRKTYLLKPQTYMNHSGVSVGAALRFFKLPLAALVVIA